MKEGHFTPRDLLQLLQEAEEARKHLQEMSNLLEKFAKEREVVAQTTTETMARLRAEAEAACAKNDARFCRQATNMTKQILNSSSVDACWPQERVAS